MTSETTQLQDGAVDGAMGIQASVLLQCKLKGYQEEGGKTPPHSNLSPHKPELRNQINLRALGSWLLFQRLGLEPGHLRRKTIPP